MDTRSLNNLNTLHPDARVRQDAIDAWTECQALMPDTTKIVVVQGLRTFEESTALFKLGRIVINPDGRSKSKPYGNTVTKATAGQSYHNYGLAFDFAMITNGKDDYSVGPLWMKVVAVMKKHGWSWGGNFPEGQHDNPHLEKHFGLNWRELLAMYNAKKFIPGTTYINLKPL
jgi:peptidoglycan L-alanyl-D-glutamate endopeptidase CwlK